MCMASTKFTMVKDKKGEFYGVGYKYIPPHMMCFNKKIRVGRWMDDTNTTEINGYPNYAPGFHILQNKSDAITIFGKENIYKVYFKNLVAFGEEHCGHGKAVTFIARKIKVVEKVQ